MPEFENRISRFDKKLRVALSPITTTLTEGVQPLFKFISPSRRYEAYLVFTLQVRCKESLNPLVSVCCSQETRLSIPLLPKTNYIC